MIFAGDFLQLPPVMDSWAFFNPLFDELDPIFLEKNMRQKEDKPWCDLLNRMSIGECTEDDFKLLKTKKILPEASANIECDMRLYPTTDEVTKFNDRAQNMLLTETVSIKAIDRFGVNDEAAGHLADEYHVPGKNSQCGGLHKLLRLSIGSRVMLIRNIGDGLVNGSMGTVFKVQKDDQSEVSRIWVSFDDKSSGIPLQDPNVDNTVPIEKVDSEFLYYSRYITRTQFPIIPAWSVTIHKAQGQSLNSATISVEKNFCAGQAYVAFSRLRSFDGLNLEGEFKTKTKTRKGSFNVSQDALEFLLQMRCKYQTEVKEYVKGHRM